MDFEAASRATPADDGTFVWHPDPRWNQGRGIYGGLTFATIVGAVESMTELPIRHLSAELCAPISPKPCMIRLSLKRKGRHTAFFAGELLQEETTVALTHVTCGADRASDLDQHPTRFFPEASGPSIPASGLVPDFSQFFKYWPDHGFPMSGACEDTLRTGGWIAPRFESSSTAALIVALIDAWWPAVFTAAKTPRPMGTMFAVDILDTKTVIEGPTYLQIETQHVANGYAIEIDRLWSKEGRLLGQAQQNIAVIA